MTWLSNEAAVPQTAKFKSCLQEELGLSLLAAEGKG